MERFPNGHSGSVDEIEFSPDGCYLASGGRDHAIRVWDVLRGREAHKYTGFDHCITFSPEGRTLAWVGVDESVSLLNIEGDETVRFLRGQVGHIGKIAFNPTGERLASASTDGTVKLWDVTTGQEMLTLKGQKIDGKGLAFSPAGWGLVATGGDGAIHLWDAGVLAAEGELPDRSMLSTRGLMRVEAGWWESAVSDLSAVIERGGADWTVWHNRGRAHAASNHGKEALDDYQHTLQLEPNVPAVYLSQHLVHAALGRWDEAAKSYGEAATRARAIKPRARNYSPKYFSTPSYEVPGSWAGVMEDLTRSIDEGTAEWWTWRARGLAYLARSEWAQAADDLTKALESRPDDADSLIARGKAYMEQDGQLAKAR